MVKLRQKNKFKDAAYNKLLKSKESDSESGEETELFVKNKPQRIEFPTIDKVVEEGDTLQSLAVRYHCSVAELKRINHFHKENEIFAKRVIKVPHRPFTAALVGVHISGNSSPEPNNVPTTSRLIDVESLSRKLNISAGNRNSASAVNEIIFNSQITQKTGDRSSPDVTENKCDEEVYLLPTNVKNTENDLVISRLSCNGADADISWKLLLACVVIGIVALPLIYVFYIAEHPEQYHHQHLNGT